MFEIWYLGANCGNAEMEYIKKEKPFAFLSKYVN